MDFFRFDGTLLMDVKGHGFRGFAAMWVGNELNSTSAIPALVRRPFHCLIKQKKKTPMENHGGHYANHIAFMARHRYNIRFDGLIRDRARITILF